MPRVRPNPVFVLDDVAGRRHTIEGWLRHAGLRIADADDALRSIRHDEAAFVIGADTQSGLHRVQRVRAAGAATPIVAVIGDDSAQRYEDAIRAGATTLHVDGGSRSALLRALGSALRSETVLPRAVVAQILRIGGPRREMSERLSGDDVALLRDMSNGTTIATIARRRNVSERSLYRQIDGIIEALDVTTRQSALVKAAAYGLLDEAWQRR